MPFGFDAAQIWSEKCERRLFLIESDKGQADISVSFLGHPVYLLPLFWDPDTVMSHDSFGKLATVCLTLQIMRVAWATPAVDAQEWAISWRTYFNKHLMCHCVFFYFTTISPCLPSLRLRQRQCPHCSPKDKNALWTEMADNRQSLLSNMVFPQANRAISTKLKEYWKVSVEKYAGKRTYL